MSFGGRRDPASVSRRRRSPPRVLAIYGRRDLNSSSMLHFLHIALHNVREIIDLRRIGRLPNATAALGSRRRCVVPNQVHSTTEAGPLPRDLGRPCRFSGISFQPHCRGTPTYPPKPDPHRCTEQPGLCFMTGAVCFVAGAVCLGGCRPTLMSLPEDKGGYACTILPGNRRDGLHPSQGHTRSARRPPA